VPTVFAATSPHENPQSLEKPSKTSTEVKNAHPNVPPYIIDFLSLTPAHFQE
jgi:hypothetical protein